MRRFLFVSPAVAICLVVLFRPSVATAAIEVASNTTSIAVPDSGTSGLGSPYPSTINIPVAGIITDVNVSLLDISHTSVFDIAALLVGPGGQNVVLINSVGFQNGVSNVDLTFDDSAADKLSQLGSVVSGTFQPANLFTPFGFSEPAPEGPYGETLSEFNGTNPFGEWRLYVEDRFPGDIGSIAGGWSLEITFTPFSEGAVPEPASLLVWGGLAAVGCAVASPRALRRRAAPRRGGATR